MGALELASDTRRSALRANAGDAVMLSRAVCAARPLVHADRQQYLDDLAWKAQCAATNHDFATTYAIIRSLTGRALPKVSQIMQKDGSLTEGDDENNL